jgi:hypothetical protein
MRRKPERRLPRTSFFFMSPILSKKEDFFKEDLGFGKKKTEASIKSFGPSPNEAMVVEIIRAVV